MVFGPFLFKGIMALDPAWRQTPAALKLGKLLFTESGQANLQANPTQIALLMAQMGFDIPKEVTISVQTAQVIMAGGTYAEKISQAKNFSQVAAPTANYVQSAMAVLGAAGVINANSALAQTVGIAANAAMIVASEGTNVAAWIGLAMGVWNNEMDTSNRAKQRAYGRLRGMLTQRRTDQLAMFGKTYDAYTKNQMSVFEFMGRTAENSPDLFTSFFPELGTFIPETTLTIWASGSKKTIWGKKKTKKVSYEIKTIINDHKTVSEGIAMKYAGLPLTYFKAIQENYENTLDSTGFPKGKEHSHPLQSRISLIDMCALSMMPPYVQVLDPDFNLGYLLSALRLAPSDFENDPIAQAVNNPHFFPNAVQEMIESPIQFYPSGGIPQKYFMPIKDTQAQKNFIAWNERKLINTMMNDKTGAAVLKEWGWIPRFNTSTWANAGYFKEQLKGYKLDEETFASLDISQLWIALGYLEEMDKSSFWGDWTEELPEPIYTKVALKPLVASNIAAYMERNKEIEKYNLNAKEQNEKARLKAIALDKRPRREYAAFNFDIYNFPGWREKIQEKHQELAALSLARQSNEGALNNIASFLNVPIEKLRRAPLEPGKPATYYAA